MTSVQDKRKDRECTCKLPKEGEDTEGKTYFYDQKCPEHGCNHLDKDGDATAQLAGESHEDAYWECVSCGESLDEDEYNLESASSEWLEQEAEKAELSRPQ